MLRLKRIWDTDKRLSDHLKEIEAKRVLIIFWHGLGDLVMFLNPLEKLQELFPSIKIELAVQKGLGFHDVTQALKNTDVKFIDGDFLKAADAGEITEYDIIADVDFPMSEGQVELTKGEWCCQHELGIEPTNGHKKLTCGKNRLIAVQYHITCLPDSCNPDEQTAEMIWNDILECGFIPIEMHFHHAFDNPANKMFPFIDATVRRCHAKVSSLVGLMESCAGAVSVVTGNLHVALSVLPPAKIFFLEKDFKLESFTKEANKVARADLRKYNHEIKNWLMTL